MLGVVATTTTAGVATVVEAWEERRVLVVAHSAAKGATRPEQTGAAVAAREEEQEDGETAHEGLLAWDGSSTSSRSSSSLNTDHGEVTVVAGKRQVYPSLVDIASSAERLSKLTVSGDRTKPVPSDLARERTAELATAAALAKSTPDDPVGRAYVKLPYKDVLRISVLPFPASLNKSDGTQQLTRSVRSAMPDILMRCDDRCQEGARAPTWVPGWIPPLRMAFNRAITPDRPTTARMTTLIDEFYEQVSRALDGGASGPEAFTLFLRLLVKHFDQVDTGEGYTKLHTSGVCNGTPFSDSSLEFRVLVSAATRNERVLSPGTDVGLGCLGWRSTSSFRRSCLRCTLARRLRTHGHMPR